MPRVVEDPLEKVTLNLVAGDKDVLLQFYHHLGWSVAARQIIHTYCEKLRRLTDGEGKATLNITVDLSALEEAKKPAAKQ